MAGRQPVSLSDWYLVAKAGTTEPPFCAQVHTVDIGYRPRSHYVNLHVRWQIGLSVL
jgi:hypothetical protein